MDHDASPSQALPLLARLYRERRTGLLSVGPDEAPLRVLLREGQIVGLGPAQPPAAPPRPAVPRPDDSVRLRLDRVLVEVGLRPPPKAGTVAAESRASSPRSRLVEALASPSAPAAFAEGAEAGPEVVETAGTTEPLILEAVRALRDPEAVRAALGDLDQRLVATASLVEERTLTLTEGYLLSRIDGTFSAREVLQLVPLDPHETERTLLGLLLTGRVEYRPAPERPAHLPPGPSEPPPGAEAAPAPDEAAVPPAEDAFPQVTPLPEEAPPEPEPEPLDAETRERKKDIWEAFHALPAKNHFEVLGLEPGCADAEVKRAYAALVKRFHPDAQGDPRLEDMHDFLAAILIRAREALEVLGTAQSRAQYEAKSSIVRRPREAGPTPSATSPEPPVGSPRPAAPATPTSSPWPARPGPAAPPPPAPGAPPPPAPPVADYVPPEEILFRARLLLSQAKYWDVIQYLENAVPQMEPRRNQHKGRILLAKAYAKNPKWVRRALEYLDEVVREDATNVEAHYELGLLFKQIGQLARAQAAFRRVVELKPDHREAAAELGLDAGPAPGGGLLKRLLRRGKAS
jgi:tetratricopeptide (TPR) repeat protein